MTEGNHPDIRQDCASAPAASCELLGGGAGRMEEREESTSQQRNGLDVAVAVPYRYSPFQTHQQRHGRSNCGSNDAAMVSLQVARKGHTPETKQHEHAHIHSSC